MSCVFIKRHIINQLITIHTGWFAKAKHCFTHQQLLLHQLEYYVNMRVSDLLTRQSLGLTVRMVKLNRRANGTNEEIEKFIQHSGRQT